MVNYLDILKESVIITDAKVIVELGVQDGYGSEALISGAEENGGFVYGIDIIRKQKFNFEGKPYKFILGDSTTVSLDFLVSPVDLLFIDSSHEYQKTKLELSRFLPRMSDNGVILLHDVFHVAHSRDIQKAMKDILLYYPDYLDGYIRTHNVDNRRALIGTEEGIGIITKSSSFIETISGLFEKVLV